MNVKNTARTNYFRVTDESAYEELFSKLRGDNPVTDLSKKVDGKTLHGFGINGNLDFFPDMSPTMKEYKKSAEYQSAKKVQVLCDGEEMTEEDVSANDWCMYVVKTERTDDTLTVTLQCWPELKDPDMDMFCKRMQRILPDDEAFILTETGHDGLRDVFGCAYVVTSKSYEYLDLQSIAMDTARKSLGADFTTALYG